MTDFSQHSCTNVFTPVAEHQVQCLYINRQDIAEILLKAALNTITLTPSSFIYLFFKCLQFTIRDVNNIEIDINSFRHTFVLLFVRTYFKQFPLKPNYFCNIILTFMYK